MQDNSDSGFERAQAVLRYGAELAYDLSDHDLGHGIIDLCRTARSEISRIGLSDGSKELPIDSYEGLLLYRIMPEIARRLISGSGADLLLLNGERPGADVTNTSAENLRNLVGISLAKSHFGMISEKVRDRFDPDYSQSNVFYANEAISRDVRSGNILEIALNRVAPAPEIPSTRDHVAQIIHQWTEVIDFDAKYATWTPSMPEFSSSFDDNLPSAHDEEYAISPT